MVDLFTASNAFVKMLIGEDDRRTKLVAILRGAIDGVAGRTGKCQNRNHLSFAWRALDC